METHRRIKFVPAHWSVLFFIIAQVLTFCMVSRENDYLQAKQIYIPPQSSPGEISLWPQPPPPAPTPGAPAPALAPAWTSLGPILIYFFSVVIVLGVVLFVIPVSTLRKVLRAVFAFMFAWGVFIALVLWIPLVMAIAISVGVGAAWLLTPRIWLHNSVMILAMASVGVVFGRLVSPWTAIALLLVLAVYDFFAVRFGYMVWMARKLSDSNTLPAFIIPHSVSGWKASLKEDAIIRLWEVKPSERDFSLLGGGDIAFPLLLVSAAYFAYSFTSALLVAVFSFAGLMGAYWIQTVFLKGKPMPALPPIAVLSLIGMLIIR